MLKTGKIIKKGNSDEQKRKTLRTEVLAVYVKKRSLTATLYQDNGWPAKKLVEETLT